MKTIIGISQVVVGILLIIVILLQQRGGGIGVIGGAGSQFYSSRRGLEKTIYWLTIVLAVIFISLAIATFIV